MPKFLKKMYWMLIFTLYPAFAQAATFKSGTAKAMGVAILISSCLAVFFLAEGVYHYRQGQPYGKDVVSLLICAGAVAICTALFGAFGMGEAVVTPDFN